MVKTVGWRTEGGDDLAELFAVWARKMDNPIPAFNDMANHIAGIQKQWFASGGGGTWAPRKEPYRRWMKKNYPKRKTMHGPDRFKGGVMVHEGTKLRNELTRRAGGIHRFGVEKITTEGMTIGTDLPYAAAHQYGLNGLPKRPPLKELDPAAEAALTKILQTHIVGERVKANVKSSNGRRK